MPEEPIHTSVRAACEWVAQNTDNALFRDPSDTKAWVRINQDGPVHILREAASTDGSPSEFYWQRLREGYRER